MTQTFAGRYLLEKKIGTGGFSEVWYAKDEMAGDTEVAIKIYAPDKGLDDNGIKQFSREYSITAKLQHNNLLKANHYDIFDGSPYLVMPYCSKGSLQNILADKGTLSEGEILKILKDIISGLSYLHEQGIIHQDIKPDNVLIYDDGRYMLTDFGISTRMRSTLKKATSTKSAMTLAYAPPERYSANPENTKAGDIFSLGVMLYELATGDVPWDGNGGMVLLTGAQIPRIPNSFSSELQNLIFTCMSKEKEGRPSTDDITNIYTEGKEYKKETINTKQTQKRETRKTVAFDSTKLIVDKDKPKSNIGLWIFILFTIVTVAIIYLGVSKSNNNIIKGDNEESIKVQNTKLEINSDDEILAEDYINTKSSNYIKDARELYDNDNYSLAITKLNEAIELNIELKNDSYFYWLRGACYNNVGNHQKAISDLSRAILFKPNEKINYIWRASSYHYLKEYSKAITDYTSAIWYFEGKEKAIYYNYRGICYAYLQEYSSAKEDYRRALKLDPTNKTYKDNLGEDSNINTKSNKTKITKSKLPSNYLYKTKIVSQGYIPPLRSSYNSSSSIVRKCYQNETVYVIEEVDIDGYYKVYIGGYYGYIVKSVIDLDKIYTYNDNSEKYPFYANMKDNRNRFTNASVSSNKIDFIKKGMTVQVLNESGAFYKIKYKNKTGYIIKLGIDGF